MQQEIYFAISDTGPGVAEEEHGQLFDRFHQLGNTYTQSEGTGLGLAISKSLVELMGGRIWLESKPGEGSTFILPCP